MAWNKKTAGGREKKGTLAHTMIIITNDLSCHVATSDDKQENDSSALGERVSPVEDRQSVSGQEPLLFGASGERDEASLKARLRIRVPLLTLLSGPLTPSVKSRLVSFCRYISRLSEIQMRAIERERENKGSFSGVKARVGPPVEDDGGGIWRQ